MPYPEDPTLRAQVLELYAEVWPDLPAGIARARRLGSEWFDVSTPFVARDADVVVAHVGVVTVDLWIERRRQRPAAVHAVCVHPDHRGRGLGRETMQRALDWVDAQGFESCILWSEKTDFYRRFGFRRCEESVFVGPAPVTRGVAGRRLDLDDEGDRGILSDLLARRTPVSDRAAAADTGWHFLVDLGLWREGQSYLWLLEDEQCLVVAERRGDELHLYDLVAESPPDLARLVAAVPGRSERVVSYVTPDRFAADLRPAPHPSEGILHVRGAPLINPALGPFAFSPLVQT
jgi:GNAT superfamily N-acetyltransferase